MHMAVTTILSREEQVNPKDIIPLFFWNFPALFDDFELSHPSLRWQCYEVEINEGRKTSNGTKSNSYNFLLHSTFELYHAQNLKC